MIKNLSEKEIKNLMQVVDSTLKRESDNLCNELRDLKQNKSKGISNIAQSIFSTLDKKLDKKQFEKAVQDIRNEGYKTANSIINKINIKAPEGTSEDE